MKSILLSLVVLAICLRVYAQTDYYANHDIVCINSVVYKVEEMHGFYKIGNITNTRLDKPREYLDGTPVPTPYGFTTIKNIGDHMAMVRTMLRETLTTSEIAALKNSDEDFSVSYIVVPNGNIEEVRFMFSIHPSLYSIPPAKWYALEQKIKQRLKYIWPDNAKNIKFLQVFDVYSFRTLFK